MKKKIRIIMGQVSALALMFTMISSASAATSYETDHVPVSAGGVNYEMWTNLYQDTATAFRGCSWVCNTTYQNVPASYMGVSNFLCRPNGVMYTSTEMTYNTSSDYFHYNYTQQVTADSNGIYSGGKVSVYTGSGYKTVSAPSTVIRFPSTKAAPAKVDTLASALDKNGNYPVTKSGETYGSVLLADVVGEEPDLILAEGTNGATGYVLADDLVQDIKNPKEATVYMAELKSRKNSYRAIPLYDLDKNVIGSFNVQRPDFNKEVPEEIQAVIDRLNVERNLPRNSKGETYGTIIMENNYDIKLDLLAASGTKGQFGYIRRSDTFGGKWDSPINTPEDAMKYMAYLSTKPKQYLIPLYDSEGNVIGEFLFGGASDFPAEEIAAQAGAKR